MVVKRWEKALPECVGSRQMASVESQSLKMGRTIHWLKGHFNQPLRVNDLEGQVHMKTSTFHHHFRAVTSMSPLRNQKWLRLKEARKLMLVERLDTAIAAFQVSYESPSQFCREYCRMFGNPPMRDITHLRQNTAQETV